MNHYEEQTARLLDEYITARQHGSAAPTVPDLNAAVVLIEVAQSAHPDPEFVQQLEAALMERFTEQTRTPSRSYRWLAAAAAIVLLIGAVYLATPSGRAFADSLFRFFRRDQDDATAWQTFESLEEIPTPVATAIQVTEEPGAAAVLPSELVQNTPYEIHVPGFTPEHHAFASGKYNPEDGYTTLVFNCTITNSMMPDPEAYALYMKPVAEDDVQAELNQRIDEQGASAVIEPIQLHNGTVNAEFVAGTWIPDPDQDFSIIDDAHEMQMIWDSTQPWYRLIWYENGYLYTLSTYNGAIPELSMSECATGRDVFVTIAESIP